LHQHIIQKAFTTISNKIKDIKEKRSIWEGREEKGKKADLEWGASFLLSKILFSAKIHGSLPTREVLKEIIEKYFKGDWDDLITKYYNEGGGSGTFVQNREKTNLDNLIKKNILPPVYSGHFLRH
jgi:hypothetical protein